MIQYPQGGANATQSNQPVIPRGSGNPQEGDTAGRHADVGQYPHGGLTERQTNQYPLSLDGRGIKGEGETVIPIHVGSLPLDSGSSPE